MSNFLLKDPDAVLIHIPKNGGTSIRYGSWEGRASKPEFGHIPEEWDRYFKFTIIRDPLSRLVSAWLMSRDGTINGAKKPKFSKKLKIMLGLEVANRDQLAKLPGISLKDFINLINDDSVDYDYANYKSKTVPPEVSAKHHAQTHPYNCLDKADFIARNENFNADLQKISEILKYDLQPVKLKQTKKDGSILSYFDNETFEMAVEIFKEDFKQLEYKIPDFKSE